jgi:hypothetical protein
MTSPPFLISSTMSGIRWFSRVFRARRFRETDVVVVDFIKLWYERWKVTLSLSAFCAERWPLNFVQASDCCVHASSGSNWLMRQQGPRSAMMVLVSKLRKAYLLPVLFLFWHCGRG